MTANILLRAPCVVLLRRKTKRIKLFFGVQHRCTKGIILKIYTSTPVVCHHRSVKLI